jgi:hypothetical protein
MPSEQTENAGVIDPFPPLRKGHCPTCDGPISDKLFETLQSRRKNYRASYGNAMKSVEGLLHKLQDLQRKMIKPGRALKPGTPGEKSLLGVRVTAELKARLDQAAHESGRSQSAEAEARLEKSFDRQGLLVEVLDIAYGSKITGILLMLAAVMDAVARFQAHEGDEDESQTLRAAMTVLEAALPTEVQASGQLAGPAMAVGLVATLSKKSVGRTPFRTPELEAIRALVDPAVIDRMSAALLGRGMHEPGTYYEAGQAQLATKVRSSG